MVLDSSPLAQNDKGLLWAYDCFGLRPRKDKVLVFAMTCEERIKL